MMNERTCQKWLAALWLGCGGLILVVMVVQDSRQVYGAESPQAWTWFETTIVPTASLIVGALAYGSRSRSSSRGGIDPLMFYVTLGLSMVYLFLALSVVLLSAIVGLSPIEAIIGSNRWLPLLQGVVGVSLGVFFVAGNQSASPTSDERKHASRR